MSRRPLRALAVTALRAALLMAVVRTFLSITLLLCLSGQALGQTSPTIAVKMIDSVNSNQDPPGKQYRAGLIRPVNIGNGVIVAQGSPATVTLAKNGSTWNIQLSSLLIRDQVTPVTSNPGTIIGAAGQALVANAANAANAVLGSFGRKPNTYSPAAVVAMGERVILTPGISLSFVLNPVPVVPEANPAAAPAPANPAPVSAGQGAPAQAQKQQGGGWWWYCRAYPYLTGVFFYPANITTRADVDAAIQEAWGKYITRKHPNENLGTGCMLGDQDQASKFHDHERASQKEKVIDVDWKYVPGQDTPPTPSLAVGYCVSDPDKPPIYFSDIFGTNIPLSEGVTTNIGNAFNQYLKEKYKNISNYQGCNLFRSTSDAEARKQALEAPWKRANKQIIETGWKWVLPPGTAVASASGKGKPSYCVGYNGNTQYSSDIFEMPPNTPLYPVIHDFARFVIEKYGLEPGRDGTGHWEGGVVCPSSDNKDPGKQYGREKGYKIIETGWKPKNLPPPNLGP
jgi:hypothetical protein